MNRDTFSTYHPAVNFFWFGLVIGFAMFFFHPLCQSIALVAALTYSIYLRGKKAICFQLKYMLPLLVITALLNPAFNHEGATILAYLRNDNPLTLESVCYGLAAAVMLITVISWFGCYNEIMTSDKFIYLFGRIIPALSLVLSMTLRFIPRFKAQLKLVVAAQRNIGRDMNKGSGLARIKKGITILSVMVTWALENAIETADSMKARGYGLPGRSAFSLYRFDKRDKIALIFLLVFGSYIIVGAASGGVYWAFFPVMKGAAFSVYSVSIYFVYLGLCLAPVILNIREDRQWKLLRSGI